jgi:gamma-glutamyltranspeptidase/glutathione hydrolase
MGARKGGKNLKFETVKREVVASRGVVATNNPLGSAAGVEMLARGGNAFDAAVASLFALTVAEPMMVSMFGAGFFVLRDGETGKVETIDNYAVAPYAATDDMYSIVKGRKPGQPLFQTEGRKNVVGHLAVGVPGNLKAWEHVAEKYGRLTIKELISPAIRFARDGYRATEYLAYNVENTKSDLERFPASREIYLPQGEPLKAGSKVVMKDYADTLERVAKQGSGYLYTGDLGRAVVEEMEANGGLITMDDLEGYQLIPREPVTGNYRDEFEVYAMPPGSSGGTHIIQMLNMLERFDVGPMGFGTVEHIHLAAEVLKIAFADRQRYMGDPSRVRNPVEGLTSKAYAEERVKEIGEKAKVFHPGSPHDYEGEGSCTTHVTTMDSDGNMVAATQTLNGMFGSRVMVPGTGMLLNNCMALFDPRPGRANSVAGGKRMLSSMSPTLVMKNSEPFLAIGGTGGIRIFPEVCQALVNIIDFRMTLQRALEAPRFWTMGMKGTPGEKLLLEEGFEKDAIAGLMGRGHVVVSVPKVGGSVNAIMRDASGMLHGGGCWRTDSSPAGLSGGLALPKAMQQGPPV